MSDCLIIPSYIKLTKKDIDFIAFAYDVEYLHGGDACRASERAKRRIFNRNLVRICSGA